MSTQKRSTASGGGKASSSSSFTASKSVSSRADPSPAIIGANNSSKASPNGRPMQDSSSVGSATEAMGVMSLNSPPSRQNGVATVAGRDSGSPATPSTVYSTPSKAAMSASASLPAMQSPPAGTPAAEASSVGVGAARHTSSSGSASAECGSGGDDTQPAPVVLDPRSVAAHVALPGDKFSASSHSHSLMGLMMGKTLGTGTFGRVRMVRSKRSGEFFALKIMTIQEVVRLKQIEHVKSEKTILTKIKQPFIVDLKWTHHDRRFLYMLLEFVVGGELFSYLRAVGRFHTGAASFYAAEIVSALEHLHSHSIIYRDLKPENLLIDGHGHIKITDFGFAKELSQDNYTWTLCGTPEYLAPEIIQNRGHGKAVDWWALGILIYEMLVGYPPFFDDTPFGIYEKILSGVIDYPRFLESASREIIKKLLVGDRTKRLGSMRGGSDDVKKHRFFRDYDFQKLVEKKCKPPFVPTCPSSTADYASNFDDYPEEDLARVTPVGPIDLAAFSDF